MICSFRHTTEIHWMLPGVAPTDKVVEVPLVSIVCVRGKKLYHEHIYWDQASVLAQIGLIDPTGLPVAGADTARKVLDKKSVSFPGFPTHKTSIEFNSRTLWVYILILANLGTEQYFDTVMETKQARLKMW
jgi:hypothetical protein